MTEKNDESIYILKLKYFIMQTNRFETFIDAIIAIIITVLILKIAQPAEPTLSAIWDLKVFYIAYLISFLTLFNIWYTNHKKKKSTRRLIDV